MFAGVRRASLFVLLSASASCTGEGDGHFSLRTGIYALSHFDVATDGCAIDPESFSTQVVAVEGDRVTLGGFLELTRSGDELSGEATVTEPYDSRYDCVLDKDVSAFGEVTGDDAFDLTSSFHFDFNAGAECGLVGVTFPCTTEVSFHAAH